MFYEPDDTGLLVPPPPNFSNISCSASTFCPTPSEYVFDSDKENFCLSMLALQYGRVDFATGKTGKQK